MADSVRDRWVDDTLRAFAGRNADLLYPHVVLLEEGREFGPAGVPPSIESAMTRAVDEAIKQRRRIDRLLRRLLRAPARGAGHRSGGPSRPPSAGGGAGRPGDPAVSSRRPDHDLPDRRARRHPVVGEAGRRLRGSAARLDPGRRLRAPALGVRLRALAADRRAQAAHDRAGEPDRRRRLGPGGAAAAVRSVRGGAPGGQLDADLGAAHAGAGAGVRGGREPALQSAHPAAGHRPRRRSPPATSAAASPRAASAASSPTSPATST